MRSNLQTPAPKRARRSVVPSFDFLDAERPSQSPPRRPSINLQIPDRYAMICDGSCLEPLVHDGARLLFSAIEPCRRGDLVAIWLRPEYVDKGEHQARVKRLLYVIDGGFGLAPALIVEMLNPQTILTFDMRAVLTFHRCLGVAPTSLKTRIVRVSDMVAEFARRRGGNA